MVPFTSYFNATGKYDFLTFNVKKKSNPEFLEPLPLCFFRGGLMSKSCLQSRITCVPPQCVQALQILVQLFPAMTGWRGDEGWHKA